MSNLSALALFILLTYVFTCTYDVAKYPGEIKNACEHKVSWNYMYLLVCLTVGDKDENN